MGGKGEMIKTPDDLQDLRRKIYAKAKAEAHWRFWGLTSVASAAWRVDGDRSTRPRRRNARRCCKSFERSSGDIDPNRCNGWLSTSTRSCAAGELLRHWLLEPVLPVR